MIRCQLELCTIISGPAPVGQSRWILYAISIARQPYRKNRNNQESSLDAGVATPKLATPVALFLPMCPNLLSKRNLPGVCSSLNPMGDTGSPSATHNCPTSKADTLLSKHIANSLILLFLF